MIVYFFFFLHFVCRDFCGLPSKKQGIEGFIASYKIEKNTCGIPQVRKKNEASRTSIVEIPFPFSKYSYSQHSRCNVNSAFPFIYIY